jgi:uncharacterized membrane protein YedE/YeeE
MRRAVAFAAGVLFAAGLCISGMTSPSKVVGFLDLQAWDPSLLFTMLGAVCVSFLGWRLRTRMARPLAGGGFPDAPPAMPDRRLLVGAALFGIGWGMGGFCPGPALVSLGAGIDAALVVVPAMLGGMLLFRFVEHRDSPDDARRGSPEARGTA